MKAPLIFLTGNLLFTGLALAAPVSPNPSNEALKELKKRQWALNCSSEAFTYFCENHGAFCISRDVSGSAPCRRECRCLAVCTQTGCHEPYPGGSHDELFTLTGDSVPSAVAEESTPTSEPIDM